MTRSPTELGEIVRDRRLAIGLTQIAVVEAANKAVPGAISEPTYRALERGRTEASDRVLSAASRGLRWSHDALRRIRDGESPAFFDRTDPPEPTDPGGLAQEVAELRSQVDELTTLVRAALSGDASRPAVDPGEEGSHRPSPPPIDPDDVA